MEEVIQHSCIGMNKVVAVVKEALEHLEEGRPITATSPLHLDIRKIYKILTNDNQKQ